MRIEKLNLSHQEPLYEKLRTMKMDISEYTFANLYLFRKVHAYEVIFGRDIYLKGRTRDHFTFLMLTTPIEKIDWKEMRGLLEECDCLFPIPEEWAWRFNPKEFQHTFSDDDSDYIFEIEKIRTYPGRHLDGKRNLVKQFKELYPWQSYFLSSDRVKDAFYVLDAWKGDKSGDLCSTDYCSCMEALELMGPLALNGKIYYSGQEPIAFILGESLHEGTYAVHFAKANRNFKGVYQFIYQDFAGSLDAECKILNFEPDLGIQELRKAKTSYFPDKRLTKLRLFLRRLI